MAGALTKSTEVVCTRIGSIEADLEAGTRRSRINIIEDMAITVITNMVPGPTASTTAIIRTDVRVPHHNRQQVPVRMMLLIDQGSGVTM
jgi:hypothetical protein